jgi:hypothetical protein
VEAALRSRFQPKAEAPLQERLHFRARLRMTRQPLEPPRIDFQPPQQERLGIGAETIYKVYFHGPAYRVLERAGIDDAGATGLLANALPANASPANAEELAAPRLLELCFQTAGVWLLVRRQTLALPARLGRLRVYTHADGPDGGRLFALVSVRRGGEAFDARVVDEQGRVHLELDDYRTVALPGHLTLVA